MKENGPVTQREVFFEGRNDLVSVTDTQGKIKFVNDDFVSISGFSREELTGKDHNIVRHPDMPAAAFKSLWSTVKAGNIWRGIVKNRCKNGDHYWVEAFVSPIMKNGKLVAIQSVRSEPSKDQVADADALYKKMRSNTALELPEATVLERVTFNQLFAFNHLIILLCSALLVSQFQLSCSPLILFSERTQFQAPTTDVTQTYIKREPRVGPKLFEAIY